MGTKMGIRTAIEKAIDPITWEVVTRFNDGTCSRTGNMHKLLKYIKEYEAIRAKTTRELHE